MTVSTTSSKITYNANGSTTAWSFSFPGVSAENIFVFVTNDQGTVTQIPTSAYTVTLNEAIDPNPTSVGGIVNYPTSGSPIAVGNLITIVRLLEDIQPVSISNQSIIYPPVIEQEFDYLTMIDQQFSEAIDRSIKVNIADPPMPDLPPVAFRLNKAAIFDSFGNLVPGNIPGGGVNISAAMIPVVTAPTLPLARDAMGVAAIDSPNFTGVPTAPTQTSSPHNNDDTLATTAFVQALGATLGVLIPAGTEMLFHQSSPPVGWTKVVLFNDFAVRVVSGPITSGGTVPFSTAFGSATTGDHVLTINELANHTHGVNDPTHSHSLGVTSVDIGGTTGGSFFAAVNAHTSDLSDNGVGTGISLSPTGSNLGHTHPLDLRVQYVDMIIATKD